MSHGHSHTVLGGVPVIYVEYPGKFLLLVGVFELNLGVECAKNIYSAQWYLRGIRACGGSGTQGHAGRCCQVPILCFESMVKYDLPTARSKKRRTVQTTEALRSRKLGKCVDMELDENSRSQTGSVRESFESLVALMMAIHQKTTRLLKFQDTRKELKY